MRILAFSDLHLEFGTPFETPGCDGADVLVLAGDIMTFKDPAPLGRILGEWRKPALFVAGNHEYYHCADMGEAADGFAAWLADNHPHAHFLRDEGVSIDGVHFFGGTMWTDFSGGSERAMWYAQTGMSDFRVIRTGGGAPLAPQETVGFHNRFVEKLTAWFESPLEGRRAVVTHHAPVVKPKTKYKGSPLSPAFNATDMAGIIDRYQPDLWIYGHTHECDDQAVEGTRIISNQRGYHYGDRYECGDDFDPEGLAVDL